MDLYKDQIIEHWKNPRNFKRVKNPTSSVQLNNPLCGDKIGMSLYTKDGEVVDIGFWGGGCVISQAAASLLTERARKLKTIAKIKKINEKDYFKLLGISFSAGRRKCALLPLEVLKEAIRQIRSQNSNL